MKASDYTRAAGLRVKAGRPATPPAPGFGTDVRTAREAAGLTVKQLAARLGTTEGQIRRWEHGRQSPRPYHIASTLADIRRACGIQQNAP